MTNLISGKEAFIALANGEEVEFHKSTYKVGVWCSLNKSDFSAKEVLDEKITGNPYTLKFRLKPKTITINNIEVPKPFVPKVGETYWCFSTQTVLGYGHNVYVSDYDDKRFINMGAWRSEEEIKQVVAALRSVFKTNKNTRLS